MTIMPIVNIMLVGVAATAQTAHSLSQWRGCTSRLCLFLAHQMATDLKVSFYFYMFKQISEAALKYTTWLLFEKFVECFE